MSETNNHFELAELVVEEVQPRVNKPHMYKVVLNNDDFTPMDFVIGVLIKFFAMAKERATQVMLQVHLEGKGICGIYTRDIAETKVVQVNDFARSCEYPLLCSMEIA